MRHAAFAGVILLCLTVRTAAADSMTIAWDPNPAEDEVLSYTVHIGTEAGAYPLAYDVGTQTSYVYANAVAGQLYFIKVTAHNVLGVGAYSITTGYSNAPPWLTNPGNPTSPLSQAVALQLQGGDLYGEPITFSASGLPAGLTLDVNSGLISGAPTTVGANSVSVTATDGLLSTPVSFTWTIDGAPPTIAITTPTTQATYTTTATTVALGGVAGDDSAVSGIAWVNSRGGAGTAYGTAPWSIASISLQLGVNVITVTATDAVGRTTSAVLTVTYVDGTAPTVAFTIPAVAATYTTTLAAASIAGTASDAVGVTSVTWASDRGASGTASIVQWPAWWMWSASSAALAPGLNVMTVTAWDAAGNSGSAVLTIKRNQAPVVTNPGSQTAYQSIGFSGGTSASDADGDPVTWSATNLPPGITINPSTGALSGTPTTIGTYAAIISATDGVSVGQAPFAFTVASPIPVAATPIGPNGLIATTTPGFSWSAVPLTAYYLLSITDATPGSPLKVWYTPAQAQCPSGSGTCTVAAPRALMSGLANWQVLTWNTFGYGPWSSTINTVVDVADPSVPMPGATGPSGAVGTRTPTYQWSAVSTAIWYQLSVTDAASSTTEFWFTPAEACPATLCSTTPNVQLAIGPAQWRVRAWRASGSGPWSSWMSFDATDTAPGKVTLISPSAPVASTTPTFTWNAVLGTSYYLLRITDRDNVVVDRWYLPSAAGCPAGAGTCTISPGIEVKAGAATWQALSWNGSGYGPWSDLRGFLVETPDPTAGTPTALSPTAPLSSTNVTYRWSPIALALSYRLSISNNGGSPIYLWYAGVAAGCDPGSECAVTPDPVLMKIPFLQNGTMQWRVQAWTSNGYGPWTTPIDLVVAIGAPAAVTPIGPSGGAGSASPAFTWNASALASLYYVTASDSTGVKISRWLTPSQVSCSGGGVCSMAAGVTLASGGGSWKVIAWNPGGYSVWSSTLSFTIP
jgi:hypothetical protein